MIVSSNTMNRYWWQNSMLLVWILTWLITLWCVYIQLLFLQIRGTPWTTDYNDRRINVTNMDTVFDVEDTNNPQFTATVQQSLPPGTNCTFYLCYKQRRVTPPFNLLGRVSPVSCVTGKSLHTHIQKCRSTFKAEKFPVTHPLPTLVCNTLYRKC